jgi:hypothetical protein
MAENMYGVDLGHVANALRAQGRTDEELEEMGFPAPAPAPAPMVAGASDIGISTPEQAQRFIQSPSSLPKPVLDALPSTQQSIKDIEAYEGDLDAEQHAITARKADQQAQVIKTELDQDKERLKATDDEAKSFREQAKESEALYDKTSEQLAEHIKQGPPEQTYQKVLGIVGSIVSMANPNVGKGIMMLGDMIDSSAEDYATTTNQLSGLVELYGQRSSHKDAKANNAYEFHRAERAAHWAVVDHTLDYIEKTTGSEESRRLIAKVRAGTRKQEIAKDIAARQAAQLEKLYKAPITDLIAMKNAGKLGKKGQDILAERLKDDQNARLGELNIENQRLANDKLRAGEVASSPAGRAIDGLVPIKDSIAITDQDYKKAEEVQSSLIGLETSLDRLKSLQGVMTPQGKADYDIELQNLVALFNQARGAGVLNEGEYKTLVARIPRHSLDNAQDVLPMDDRSWLGIGPRLARHVFVDDEAVLEGMKQSARERAKRTLRTYGYDFNQSTGEDERFVKRPPQVPRKSSVVRPR